MELAVTVDAGEPFVKATDWLEGDGPLVFTAYEEIATLRATISNAHYPNINAVATKLSSGRAVLKQQLIDYANFVQLYNCFKDQQMEDYIEASIMLQYNCR